MKNRTKKGFTLVELVVVVLIIALLAALAAPRFLGMTAKANDSGAKHTLAIIRDAIELYVAENNGAFPSAPETQLLTYLRDDAFPACPVGGLAATAAAQINIVTGTGPLAADSTPAKGWKYNSDNGELIINSSGTSVIDGASYDTW
jgi:prepilin-type N-terminal cleavage/methylation domain-containing protein